VIARGLVVVLACAACGDNLERADPLTAVSGSRLALQKYRYDDGTEQAVANEFYDTELHARCTPRPWIDGAVRCVPVADDAAYVDPACTTPIGLGRTIAKPTHFIGFDGPPTSGVAARVFRAGAVTEPITQYYGIAGGACVGPVPVPAALMSFFAVGDELDGASLVALRDGEIGDDRLAVQLRETDDGLRVPSGVRDRELDVACVPRLRVDGGVVCEPIGAAAATFFHDPVCGEPVVAATARPAVARVAEPSGCASYHRVGSELSDPVYRRDGDTCSAVAAPAGARMFRVEAAIELPALGRSLEDVPGRRLRRITLDHGGLRFLAERLFDTATGVDCELRSLRSGLRCLPASVVAATTLFTAACASPVSVAEVPVPGCEPLAYATSPRPFQIREIGELVETTMFRFDAEVCRAYTGAPGTELRVLGPPLDLAVFPGAIYFGERPR
jgi:hypothetical protein